MSITIEEGLRVHLLADLTLSSLIDDRIFIIKLPQTITIPAITYQRVSNARPQTLDQDETGLSMPRFQFDIYAEDYSTAKSIMIALRNSLLGFRGEFGTLDKIAVQGILFEHEQDDYEPETELYRLTVDYRIMYAE